MNIYTPIVSIVLYITSLIAPVDVKEISIASDGQVMVFQRIDADHWKATTPAGTVLEYQWTGGEFIERMNDSFIKEKIKDHLALPINFDHQPIQLKRTPMSFKIEKHEELIIFRIEEDDSPESQMRVSWAR